MKKFFALLLALAMVLGLAACTTPDAPKDAKYTYDVNMTEFPTLWNPHTWTTSASGTIMGYIQDSLYSFDYNEDETGFALVPSMAAQEPIDITSEFVGKFGIEEGDANLVYKFVLRQDLSWQDGTPINAHSYVESAKRLLNPKAQNFRADTLYSGAVQIVGAKDYLKQGQSGWFAADDVHTTYSTDLDALLKFALAPASDEVPSQASFRGAFGFPASYDAGMTADYLIGNYLGGTAFTKEAATAMEGKTLAEIKADPTLKAAWEALIGWWQTDPDEELDFFLAEYTYPEVSWDEVGIIALSDYELAYVLVSPSAGFDLKYSLPDGYLVHLDLYDSCESVDENGLYTNTYGTSLETTMSYGTYNMVSFQADKEVHYVRNDEHFTVKDTGYYQATDIIIHCVPEAATRLEMLISGQLDGYGLQSEDMDTYLMSDYTYLSQSASVWGMVFNPHMDNLKTKQAEAGENINKTILTVLEFRQAMCYGMNRTEFSLATMPTCLPTFGLLTNQHIVDVDAGTGYRSTEAAKQVLADVWGMTDDIGEGKLYANLDEAVESITGYNPEMAKQKFDEAYDKAIAEGLMDADDTIQICIGLPSTSSVYTNGYEFIVNNYTELVKGTKLEGKLTFTKDDTIGNAFGERLRDNSVDMLFYVGFSGSELDPFNLMSVYCDGGNLQYDPCVNYQVINMTVKLADGEWTTTVYNWYEIMNGTAHEITNAAGETKEYSCGAADKNPTDRMAILAEFEGTVMMNYDFIPLSGDASASLVGQQVHYYSDEYMYGVGFGGLKYMTFNYTDEEWVEYVASQNGELDYT